jgi:hypothetical protein
VTASSLLIDPGRRLSLLGCQLPGTFYVRDADEGLAVFFLRAKGAG